MKFFYSLFLSLLSVGLLAQQKPTLQAVRTDQPPRIDGVPDDEAWAAAPVGTDFITLQPVPGKPASQATEVRVVYDNKGLYIAATMFDSSPDSILQELTERDDIGNSDFFGISIDAYRSGLNGFNFITTPQNVQFRRAIHCQPGGGHELGCRVGE